MNPAPDNPGFHAPGPPSPGPTGAPGRLDVTERAETYATDGAADGARPHLRVYFRCAHAYVRVYRRPEASAYTARCPKCGKVMRFAVGPGGTAQRFFELSC